MALSESAKTSFAFKKLLGRDYTFPGDPRQWYGEAGGGGFNISYTEVWSEAVPSTAPGATTAVVKVYVDGADGALKLTQDAGVPNNRGWYADSGGRLKNWIPPKYDSSIPSSYEIAVYEDDGTGLAKGSKIPSSDAMDWLWDYETGTLIIQDTHSKTTPFWIEGYQYIGDKLNDSITVDALNVSGAVSVGGTLHVCGAATIVTSLAVCGTTTLHNNVIICGALTICGSATLNGSALGTGGGGATVALDNLDTVAINTSLVSDTDSTDDLGTTTVRWANLYADQVYIGSGGTTTHLRSSASGEIGIAGVLVPTADESVDIGTSSLRFKDMWAGSFVFNSDTWFDERVGAGQIAVHSSLNVSASVVIGTTLAVSGTASFNGAVNVTSILTVPRVTFDASTFIKASPAGTLKIKGNLTTTTGSTYDIGDATYKWSTIYADTLNIGSINVTAAVSIQTTLHVCGAVTLGSYLELSAVCGTTTLHNNVIICGALTICGSATLNGSALGTGGGGNDVYITESATSHLDTTGGDVHLNFSNENFNVAVNGRCATVTTVAGGAANDTYISEDASAKLNTTGSDMHLSFDASDFDITVGSGNCATVTFASVISATIGFQCFPNGEIIEAGGGGFHTDGNWDVDGELTVSATSAFGDSATAQSTRVVSVVDSDTTTSPSYGIYVDRIKTPASNFSGSLYGVGGFLTIGNTNFDGAVVHGMSFGPYGSGSQKGHAGMTSIGVDTWGGRGSFVDYRAGTAIGLRVRHFVDDFNAAMCATNSYGIEIPAAPSGDLTATTTIALKIGQTTRGTNNYQIVLSGSSTAAAGIWLGGTGGTHLGNNGTFLYAATLRNQAGTFNMRYNTTTKEVSYTSSSRKNKENIRTFNDNWNKILEIQPQKFNFIDDPIDSIGYIAEDFDAIGLKDLISYDEKGNPANIEYDKITIYLKEIVYEQQETIKSLQARIEILEKNMEET